MIGWASASTPGVETFVFKTLFINASWPNNTSKVVLHKFVCACHTFRNASYDLTTCPACFRRLEYFWHALRRLCHGTIVCALLPPEVSNGSTSQKDMALSPLRTKTVSMMVSQSIASFELVSIDVCFRLRHSRRCYFVPAEQYSCTSHKLNLLVSDSSRKAKM